MLHTLNFEGIYQYSFMKDGVIRNVVIDDYIPCFDNKPVFCSPYNLNETFGMLIEKALAKVFGCYKDIPDNPI
jgi:calpain-5